MKYHVSHLSKSRDRALEGFERLQRLMKDLIEVGKNIACLIFKLNTYIPYLYS